MSIRKTLQLTVLFVGSAAVLFGIMLWWTYSQIGRAVEQDRRIGEVSKGVFELTTVTNDYFLHHEDRAEAQWMNRFASLSSLLSGVEVRGQEEREILNRQARNLRNLGRLFTQLMSAHKQGKLERSNADQIKILEERFMGQMSILAQAMVTDAFSLTSLTGRRIARAEREGSIMLLMVGSFITLGMVYVLLLTSNRVVRGITVLHRGTEIIGAGDLNHRIGRQSNDEMGELAVALDGMTSRLQRTTVTRDALAEEVRVRKETEAAMRDSEERFRQLAENIREVFYIHDRTGRDLEYVSPAYEDIWGRRCEDVYADPTAWISAIYPDDRERVEEAWWRKCATGGYSEEYRMLRPDGSIRWIWDRSVPVRDKDGDVYRIVGIAEDITRRKRDEQELKDAAAALERSNEELEQFGYVASHDLQEPLRMVTSYLQLLERRYRGKLDADADEFIHYSMDGAQRMQQLISDLLLYSRLGTRGEAFSPVDSNEVIADVLRNLKVLIAQERAEVTHDDLPKVTVDRGQVVQLFQNLVGNAIKYHGDEAPKIHISAAKSTGGWVFSVRDNGIGIDAKWSGRIFGMFQRLHTPDEYSGTGIGLAVCKRIAERHGGTIWFDSEVGKGSTFSFSIKSAGEHQKSA